MSIDQTILTENEAGAGHDRHDGPPSANATFFVNDRKGQVAPRGEDLKGREILARTGLSAEKYELWTVVNGKTGAEIAPDETHHVKPGDHFRATIRGTDYSSPEENRTARAVAR